jgi:uncharacterized repeat protein (TIGR01451 family)
VRRVALVVTVLVLCQPAFGDVTLTDRQSVVRSLAQAASPSAGARRGAQNAAKKAEKHAKTGKSLRGEGTTASLHPVTNTTGAIALIDSSGMQYFINTDITFNTTSSASGAASEASYTGPVAATTSAGGTAPSTLNDAFDGYNTICVSTTGATGPCTTGNAAYTIFNINGPATTECAGRQIVFPTQTIGSLSVWRKVLVPTDDAFSRWINFVTNNGGAPVSVSLTTANNLGSDSNTVIVNSSDSDATAELTDTWVTTFQNYSGNSSSDPRLGHILQSAGAATPLANINFVNGDDNPFWAYTFTLAPGQTKAIMNFVTAQRSKALAASESARIATLPATAVQCLTGTELGQVVNFATGTDLSIAKVASSSPAHGGEPISFTITVTNNGPSPATNVSVSDSLPPGATFVSASGTGWTCGNVANLVTCTLPALGVGAANPITLTMIAPPVVADTTLTNTASVSSATADTNAGNNVVTSAPIPLLLPVPIPALSPWMLALMAIALAGAAMLVTGRRG